MAGLSFRVRGTPIPQPRAKSTARVIGGKAHIWTYEPVPARTWKKQIKLAASAAREDYVDRTGQPWPIETTTYRVVIVVYRPARRGDADNYAKAALDACTGVLWPDDRYIHELCISLKDSSDDAAPGIVITVGTEPLQEKKPRRKK